jgi:hypothetical protein
MKVLGGKHGFIRLVGLIEFILDLIGLCSTLTHHS